MATTSVNSFDDVPPGATVTFKSKDPGDPNVYVGILESVGTYKSIRRFYNPGQYNEAVRQADPSVSSDFTTLTYALLTIANNAAVPTDLVFADEWVAAGSLAILNQANKVTVVVEDPAENSQNILNVLINAGYACYIQS